jgi:hypothetical protein
VFTKVSEELAASVFMVKMATGRKKQMLVFIYQRTQYHITEYCDHNISSAAKFH